MAAKKSAKIIDSTSKMLYLVRHGQSTANRDYDESEAYRDAGLTDRGISQAQTLRKELENYELELAVVSPLTRALQTCQNGLPPSYTGPIIVLPDLSELVSSYYSCGQTRRKIEKNFTKQFDWSNIGMDEMWWWRFDLKLGTEPHENANMRMERFKEFIRKRPEKKIVVFSHGDYIWDFLGGKQPYLANCQIASTEF